MCDAIRHRGPDDWGVFLEGGTGLGMRRLSIIDLAGGHQPMPTRTARSSSSTTARSTTSRSIRQGLAGPGPRPPHPLRHRGAGPSVRGRGRAVPPAAPRACSPSRSGTGGAGACSWPATTSGRSRSSTPSRGGRLAFASEIKALLADDPSLRQLNPHGLDQYLALRFVHPPDTLFARIRKLPPAHYLIWEDGRSPGRALLGPRLRPQVDLVRRRHARRGSRSCWPRRCGSTW